MSEEKFITTASVLGSYRKELVEQGFTHEEAFEMARNAALSLMDEGGVAVRNV